MKLTRNPPKVHAKSAFYDRSGKFRCSGTMAAIPWNPFPVEMCQVFRVSFNHAWHLVQLDKADPSVGWVAVAVEDCERELEAFPRVRLVDA